MVNVTIYGIHTDPMGTWAVFETCSELPKKYRNVWAVGIRNSSFDKKSPMCKGHISPAESYQNHKLQMNKIISLDVGWFKV